MSHRLKMLIAAVILAVVGADCTSSVSPPRRDSNGQVVYYIDDFHQTGDSDDTAAFLRAFQAADETLSASGRAARWGWTFVLSARTYKVSQDLVLNRPHVLRGDSGTTLTTLSVTEVVFDPPGHVVIPGHRSQARSGAIGGGARIENLTIRNGGILARARVSVRDTYVWNAPRHGIEINTSSGVEGHEVPWLREPGGNANAWSLQDIGITGAQKFGVFVIGADSNAGLATAVHTHSNGAGGFYDAAFLLNTYVGCSTHETKGPSYVTANASSRKVFVGCYEEGGGQPSQLKYADVYGGNIRYNPKTPSAYNAAGRYKGVHSFVGDVAEIRLGAVAPNQLVRVNTPGGAWFVGYDPGTKSLTFKAGTESPVAFRLTGPKSTSWGGKIPLRPDRIWYDAHYVGPINQPIAQLYTRNEPPSPQGLPEGSRCTSLLPQEGQPLFWVLRGGVWRVGSLAP